MTTPFDNSRPTILCGYGALGKEIARNAMAAGVNVVGIFDNSDIYGQILPENISVIEVSYLYGRKRDNATINTNFVICAIRQQARQELREQLEALGAKHIYHATDLLRAYPNLVTLARPGTGREDREDALATRKHYADERSNRVIESIVRSWMFPQDREGPDPAEPIDDIDGIYFPDFIKPLPHEAFFDVGAFTGDTVQAFLDHRAGDYGVIVAIEPDKENHAKLQEFAGDVKNMMTFNGAASDHNGQLNFAAHADQSSHEGNGVSSVPCATIDYIAEMMDCIPSYIKVDCEGGELAVLEGAKEIIKNYLPVLAFVGYHHPRDLYELPRKMLEIAPGYKLFLRKYCPGWHESVLYAVPEDRVLWDKL